MLLRRLSLLVVGLLGCSVLQGADTGGLQTSVAVDLVGDFTTQDSSDAKAETSGSSDRFEPRGIDVVFYAPIDHVFDGLLNVAAHPEGGATMVELHEAHISSSTLIPHSKVRAGQFFLNIGRLNTIHQHDWPFITAPLAHQEFFGAEGLSDAGLEYSVLAPLPFYLDVTVGVTNGYKFGHSHDAGKKPQVPMHYVHAISFFSALGFDAQPGVTYLRRKSAEGLDARFVGAELTAKKKPGKVLEVLLQGEVWHRSLRTKAEQEPENSLGSYFYPQIGCENGMEFGVRFDYLTVLNRKDAANEPVVNRRSAVVPTVAYKASEFSTLRLAYTVADTLEGKENRRQQSVQVQTMFVLGAHPAHSF